MASLQSAFTDETYENERGEAELQFWASFQAWLKAMKPGTLSDLLPENLLRLRPEEIKLMGDLAESCEAFVKAELTAFVSLLKRLGMPASQAVKPLDDHRKATMQETHAEKWEYGLTRLFPVFRKDIKMPSIIWSQVDRSVLHFVRVDLPSLLWLPPRERGPDFRTSQERAQLEDKLLSGQELLAVAEQQGRRSPHSSGAGAATWDTIEISFLSDERVQIRNGPDIETYNYNELGFEDSRNGKPNQAWVTLRVLAVERGIIRDATKTGGTWPKVEKRMQEIRKALRNHFGISSDPILFIEGVGYQTRFKIDCSPSFHM